MPQKDACPYFHFYPEAFASDGKVEAMSTEGVGAYILLLCKAWRESPPGSLPNDDSTLARWARLSDERWAMLKSAVLAAFTLGTDDRWHQKRMRREYEDLQKHRAKRSDAGAKGAAARWKDGNRMATASDCHSERKALTSTHTSPVSLEGGAGETKSPRLAAAMDAFDSWSARDREGRFIDPIRNEHAHVRGMLETLEASPPVLVKGHPIPAAELIADAVKFLMAKGTAFNSPAYGKTCVLNTIDEWRSKGVPNGQAAPAVGASAIYERCRVSITYNGETVGKGKLGHNPKGIMRDGKLWIPVDQLGKAVVA